MSRAIAVVLALSLLVVGWALIRGTGDDPDLGPVRIKMTLDGEGPVYLKRIDEQHYRYVIRTEEGVRELSAEEFAQGLYLDRLHRPWWKRLLNVTSPIGIAWVALGLLGQALFAGRMLLQWIVTERHRQSVVPVAFWWLSLGGASMMLVYFIWRKDIVGVLGQSTGWIVYTRNLYFIHRGQNAKVTSDIEAPQR